MSIDLFLHVLFLRMYLEGKKKYRFLLSAKQFMTNDSFFISTSEDFPVLDTIPKSGYIARLDKQKDDSFLISLNQCHLCDSNLGYFHCGRGCHEREVIGRIYHYFKTFRPSNLEYRCINIMVPLISKNGKRKIWCPRSFKRSNPKLSNDIDVNIALTTSFREGVSFRFENQKPDWNERSKSLAVKFDGNRILIPSTRNFLLCTSWDTSLMKDNQQDHVSDEEDEEDFYEEDEILTLGDHSVHENEIAPIMSKSQDIYDIRESDDRSQSSTSTKSTYHSSSTKATTQSQQQQQMLSPLASPNPHTTKSRLKIKTQSSPPNSSVNAANMLVPPSPFSPLPQQSRHKTQSSAASSSASFISSPDGKLRMRRARSDASVESDSTVTTSATPTSKSKTAPFASPRSASKKKSLLKTESKILGKSFSVFLTFTYLFVLLLLSFYFLRRG
jgi:hypothetical protein